MRDRARRRGDIERAEEYESELACPPLPRALVRFWHIFLRLSMRRGSNGFSVSPITYLEIDAFCRISGVRLTPWELALIEELDAMFRTTMQ